MARRVLPPDPRSPVPRCAVAAVEEANAMRMVRDVAPVDRLPYLARLGFDPDDAGRLAVAVDRAEQSGIYVEAETGASRFFDEGGSIPEGVWIAQREIDDLRPDG